MEGGFSLPKRTMTLNRGMVTLTFFIIIFSLLIAGVFIMGSIINAKEKELQEQSLLVARTVAKLPEVTKRIEETEKKNDFSMNDLIEPIRIVNDANYIVVTNMNHIRLSHPLASQIGTYENAKDEEAAYTEHYYTSKAKGELGVMIRAFVPVMDEQYQQIGVVTVGYLLPSISEVLNTMKKEIIFALVLTLSFGLWGALIVSRRIKKQMLDYEPFELAQLYTERIETFNAMYEGIIAIDQEMRITIFNPRAKEILGVDHKSIIGQHIMDVLPDTRLPEILTTKKALYNKELIINQHSISSNRVPIEVDGEIVGAIAIFKDQTEVKQLAEELTGVKEFVHALRVQNHEHKNKLHTIAGLIQLGNSEGALNYIVDVEREERDLSRFLHQHIKDQNIAGLLLSKVNRGKELGIDVIIDENSVLHQLPESLDFHDFVIVLGNLVENAFDALHFSSQSAKELFISIDQDEHQLSLSVEDNGIGMEEFQLAQLFDNGFTTKQHQRENHGIGLYLVQGIVEKTEGTIEIESVKGQGTVISVTFYE